jgi:flagellar protein FlgJ
MEPITPLPSPPLAAVSAPTLSGSRTAMRKTAEQFEAFFLTQSLESMFAGLNADPMFGGGGGEAVYRTLLLQEYGKVAARSGGTGIADAVYREMVHMQESK